MKIFCKLFSNIALWLNWRWIHFIIFHEKGRIVSRFRYMFTILSFQSIKSFVYTFGGHKNRYVYNIEGIIHTWQPNHILLNVCKVTWQMTSHKTFWISNLHNCTLYVSSWNTWNLHMKIPRFMRHVLPALKMYSD